VAADVSTVLTETASAHAPVPSWLAGWPGGRG